MWLYFWLPLLLACVVTLCVAALDDIVWWVNEELLREQSTMNEHKLGTDLNSSVARETIRARRTVEDSNENEMLEPVA